MLSAPVAERPPRVRIQRRAVHGVLLVDKPVGLSSNDALQKAKWLLRAEKAGHTGTLDPMASGLLPLCFGAATKFSQVSLEADKCYEAVVQLGVRTTTGDSEGEVLERREPAFTGQDLIRVLAGFEGEIEQVPPMHSALKFEGRPLYEYARAGQEVPRESRRVRIHELEATWPGPGADQMSLRVRCSKGTYIRTLAEDIGQALGCGASLAALRRTESGSLSISRAVTLPALEAMPEEDRLRLLLPVDALLSAWPSVELAPGEAARFLSGLRRRLDALQAARLDGAAVRVYAAALGGTAPALLGSATVRAGELIPQRLLSPPEVQAQALQPPFSSS